MLCAGLTNASAVQRCQTFMTSALWKTVRLCASQASILPIGYIIRSLRKNRSEQPWNAWLELSTNRTATTQPIGLWCRTSTARLSKLPLTSYLRAEWNPTAIRRAFCTHVGARRKHYWRLQLDSLWKKRLRCSVPTTV